MSAVSIAYNGHGDVVEFENRPEPQLNKNTKDEANKQKSNRNTSAGTKADSDNAEANNVQPPYCQTVGCWAVR